MYNFEITRVGIPIRKSDVTQSFINVLDDIKNNKAIALMTADYIGDVSINTEYLSAPAGHNILFNNFKFEQYDTDLKYGVINTYGKIWTVNNGVHRDGPVVVSHLLNLLDKEYEKLKFKHVYMFTPGSPYVYDMFTEFIRRKRALNIVDSVSSIHVCAEIMSEYLNLDRYAIRQYVPDFIEKKDPTLRSGLNIFGSISNNYNHNTGIPMIEHFFNSLQMVMTENDMLLYANVDDDSVMLKTASLKDMINNIDYFSNPDKILTYGVFKHDNCRTV